jgi:hypothetical protein
MVAARSKTWVCGRPLAGTAGSNPTRDMDVCLLRILWSVQVQTSSRGRSPSQVNPSKYVCVCVCGLTPLKLGPLRYPQTPVQNYHSTQRNIPEDRRYLHRGGNLKSHILQLDFKRRKNQLTNRIIKAPYLRKK